MKGFGDEVKPLPIASSCDSRSTLRHAVLNGKSLIASVAMELRITMIPSPEDPPLRSEDYQSELRHLELALKADGLEIDEVGSHPVRSGGSLPISGEWKVELGAALEPTLRAPVGSWLQGRTWPYSSAENWRDRSGCTNCRGACKGYQNCQVLSGSHGERVLIFPVAPCTSVKN
jgi:hypothetical protein